MAGDAPKAKTFNCPACSASLSIRGLGQTSTYACTSCGALIDISSDEYKILRESTKLRYKPSIQLGTRGKIRGEAFEVIGFMVRTDGTGEFEWREYLLFNPYLGFRWLNENNGHWTVFRMIKDATPSRRDRKYNGMRFRHFLSGEAKVKFVYGEFYWEVEVGNKVKVSDSICPPYMLSSEINNEEEVWSYGEYLAPSEVQQAFLISDLPYRHGVAPNQPFPVTHVGYFATIASVAIIVLTVFQFIYTSRQMDKVVSTERHVFSRGDRTPAKVSPFFELTGGTANVKLEAYAEVDNSWLEADVSLINAVTGEVREAALEAAYYHGYDDGHWSEGSKHATAYFPHVPDGRYYLVSEATADERLTTLPFQVVLRRDSPYWGNYLVAFLIMGVPPGILLICRAVFESKRWSESDYGG